MGIKSTKLFVFKVFYKTAKAGQVGKSLSVEMSLFLLRFFFFLKKPSCGHYCEALNRIKLLRDGVYGAAVFVYPGSAVTSSLAPTFHYSHNSKERYSLSQSSWE